MAPSSPMSQASPSRRRRAAGAATEPESRRWQTAHRVFKLMTKSIMLEMGPVRWAVQGALVNNIRGLTDRMGKIPMVKRFTETGLVALRGFRARTT